MTPLNLAFGFQFADLYDDGAMPRMDDAFLSHLKDSDGDLASKFIEARKTPDALSPTDEADLLLALAPFVDDFTAHLFGIEKEWQALVAGHHALDPLYACKRLFIQRRAVKTYKQEEAETFDGPALETQLCDKLGSTLTQMSFATSVMKWLDDEAAFESELDLAARYGAWATWTDAGRARHKTDVLFRAPGKVDTSHLVHADSTKINDVDALCFNDDRQVPRDGFGLLDTGCDLTGALDEANYCVICHDREKDSCSKGMRDKKTNAFTQNALGTTLAGCPLEERISEMHKAKAQGHAIAALALIVVDNPMCAGTGHRICNDCMKACIYQKQDPVNIPEAETRTLKDVLELPWGFEIYSLLTRWNPLNLRRPYAVAADSGYKVLVVGLGPAGLTLAHHLMNAGHTVSALDGAKIEPLDPTLSGVTPLGNREAFEPIHNFEDIREPLDQRVMAGFGGVAEYGITVRWDKNFLKVMRVLLERRARFRLFGGVRFGSQITREQAFAMGFDHIALCLGAGKPTLLGIPGGMARGVRQASDFLMALQLTGAAREDTLANLQLRMPVVVIGGGLTAIDTATEALAYYIAQVEKFLHRYETLSKTESDATLRESWTDEERTIGDTFLEHGRAVRGERERAAKENRAPNFVPLLNAWGGATIAYRRRMTDSPSYTLNHEEIDKAFEQGIRFAELLSPISVETDEYSHTKAVRFARQAIGEDGRPASTGEEVTLPAHALLVAAGTQPNTVLAREYPGFARMDGKYFEAIDENGQTVKPEAVAKPEAVHVLMSREDDGRTLSFFGDLHPSFAGNVVKAMASAKQGFPVVDRALRAQAPTTITPQVLSQQLHDGLAARVVSVERLTSTIVEVRVHAPMAARAFKPGQFFRLQNFEALAERREGTVLAMEGLALTGAEADADAGVISMIVLEMGGSSSLVERLKPGEPVVLMGPTGTPTEIPANETVLLAGGGLGNAVLFSIGQALRTAGSKVLYFAAYKTMQDRYHVEKIEAAADTVVWCCDTAPGFAPTREGDLTFVGNVVEAMKAYGEGKLGDAPIALNSTDRIIAIGSDMMMNAVHQARSGVLKPLLKPGHIGIGSINSPMQCMMKEICAQCLQTHVDPETGEESVVFSCFNQDQSLDRVDFSGLHQRLKQNGVQEKLSAHWISHLLSD